MNNIIWIIGTGPGSKDYLTPAAIEKVAEQDLLIGSQKALEMFAYFNKENYVFKNDVDPLVDFLKNNYQKKKIALLVTGDPGIYSLANTIKNHFDPETIRILPGISSVQLFFAKIGLSYEDVKVESVHGRGLDDLIRKIAAHQKVCILTDAKNNVQQIAQSLLQNKVKAKAWVGQDISLPTERLIQKSLEEFSKNGGFSKALMYLEIEESK